MFTRAAAHNGSDSKSHHSSIFGGKENSTAFIQPKLNVGKPGDKYEVEADKAADQIVAKGKENTTSFLAPAPAVQKQTDEDVQKKETSTELGQTQSESSVSDSEIQQKPVVEPITPGVQLKENPLLQKVDEEEVQTKEEDEVQTKEVKEDIQAKDTSTSSATEEEEVHTKEAEEEVQQKTEEEVQTKKEDEVQTQPETELFQLKEVETKPEPKVEPVAEPKPESKPILQKQPEEDIQSKEEEEIQEKEEEEVVQKQSTSAGDDGSNIESQLSDSKGGGSPLESGTRSEMESGFGADFSGVRVHNDSNAVQMNQDLGSQAFTNGNDIYFNEGKYNPDSDAGKHLLAHELTHTVQQGASPSNTVQQSTAVQMEPAAEPTKPEAPTTVIDLTQGLKLSQDWKDYIEANSKEKSYDVSVKIGSEYKGTISLKKLGKPKEGEDQKFELASKTKKYLDIQGMDFLNPLKDAQIFPILVLNNFGDEQTTSGFLSVRNGNDPITTNALGIIDSVNKNLETMGFLGIDKINTGGLENKFENGGLNFKANEISVGVDGYIEASGSLGITNSAFTFDVTSTVSVAGLAEGEFNLKRDEKGQLAGKASISADIANVGATLTIEYEKGIVTIQGTGRMSSEKFSGEITLLVTDESKSKQMMHAALGVETMEAEAQAPAAAPVKKTKGNQVLAGWGTVEATITPWLQGTANIGIDNKGQVTIVGTISAPNEIELMEQRGIKHDLFDVEIRAGYGIPLVGQVFLFASIGMFMNAGFGPLVLKDVAFTGTYSTDPSVLQNFSITGTLGINAFAILGLKAEAGVGVTLLGHDVKAGVAVTAAAGIKAYAEATPTFEYKEQKSPEGGKVGGSRLKGHFEAAAQLFLQLTGSLFYELDSPWWSPAPDGREDYPLGEVQYPIGDSMGIGADVDWLVGSEEPPELKFSPVEFDPDKFTADVMTDPPPKKMGKSDQNPKGKFEDKGGGDQQKDPKATGDGKGLPPNSKKEEDLKNLPDDQKYLRGLDELSKLEKADPKPTVAVVEAKMKKVKSKYGLQTVNIKSEKDGEVTVYVKHKKQDNTKNLLKIKTMSEAERKKLLDAAMTDLKKREEKIVDKEGKTEEAKAKDMLTTWAKAHPIIESAKVIDGKTTWDYLLDVGDKDQTEKGKVKAGAEGEDKVDKDNMADEAKKAMDKILNMEVPFTNKSQEKHKLDFDLKGDKIILFRKSIPQDIESQIAAIKQAVANEEGKSEDQKVGTDVLNKVNDAWGKIDKILKTELNPWFERTKKVNGKEKTVTDNSFPIKKGDEIKALLIKIAGELDEIPEIVDGKFVKDSSQERPKSLKIKYPSQKKNTLSDGTSSSEGQTMEAPLLSRIGPGSTGSQPSSAGYSNLYKALSKNGRNVVAAHLLNHQLFGPGNNKKNLTPIPSQKNSPEMEASMEAAAKDAVLKENKVISYSVTVHYGTVKEAEGDVNLPGGMKEDSMIPTMIVADLKELVPKEGEDKTKAATWQKEDPINIPTKPVIINYQTDLKVTKKGKGNVIVLEKLREKLDDKLREKPDIKWSKVANDNSFMNPLKDMAGPGKDHKETFEYKTLKQEFIDKKNRLGKKLGPSESFQEYINSKNSDIMMLIDQINQESSMLALYKKSYRNVNLDGITQSKFSSWTSPPDPNKIQITNNGWGDPGNLRKQSSVKDDANAEFKQEELKKMKSDLLNGIKDNALLYFTKLLTKKTAANTETYQKLITDVDELINALDEHQKDSNIEKQLTYVSLISGSSKAYKISSSNNYVVPRNLYGVIQNDLSSVSEKLGKNERDQLKRRLAQVNERINSPKSDFQEFLSVLRSEKDKIQSLPFSSLLRIASKTDNQYFKSIAKRESLNVPENSDGFRTLFKLIPDLREDAADRYVRNKIKNSDDLKGSYEEFINTSIVSVITSDMIAFVLKSSQLKKIYSQTKATKNPDPVAPS